MAVVRHLDRSNLAVLALFLGRRCTRDAERTVSQSGERARLTLRCHRHHHDDFQTANQPLRASYSQRSHSSPSPGRVMVTHRRWSASSSPGRSAYDESMRRDTDTWGKRRHRAGRVLGPHGATGGHCRLRRYRRLPQHPHPLGNEATFVVSFAEREPLRHRYPEPAVLHARTGGSC